MMKVIDVSMTSEFREYWNRSMIDFKIEGEEQSFGINFYNDNRQGVVY